MQKEKTRKRFKSSLEKPKEEKNVIVISIKLSKKYIDMLEQEADRLNWTKSEIIRRGIDLYFKKEIK